MKRRAAKACLLFVEITAVLLAALTAGAIFFYWRLQQGPLVVDFFKPSIEFALSRRLPEGHACDIGSITIERDRQSGEFKIVLSDIEITDTDEIEIATASSLLVGFSPPEFFSGHSGPTTLEVNGAAFRIIRDADYALKIPTVMETRERAGRFNFRGIGDRLFRSAFKEAQMRNAQIIFEDKASGRSWQTSNATVFIGKNDTHFVADIAGNLDLSDNSAGLKVNVAFDRSSGVISVDANGENFPVSDLLQTFYGDRAAIVDAPVSGTANIELTSSGKVISSKIAGVVDKGLLTVGGKQHPINALSWDAAFNPATNKFRVNSLLYDVAGNNGKLDGEVEVKFGESVRDPLGVQFELSGTDILTTLPGFLPEPLLMENAGLAGSYTLKNRLIEFTQFNIDVVDVDLSGALAARFPRANKSAITPSPMVKLDLSVDGALDPQRLLRLWPVHLASGARDWISDRLPEAVLENIVGSVDLKEGAIGADNKIPDEAISLEFDVRDAKAFYIMDMTPLTRGSGHGRLRGNSFILKAEKGVVGQVDLSGGEVEFPVFIPRWEPMYIRFSTSGDAHEMLSVLDQNPLNLLSKINLSPDQFHGTADAQVEIMRPNKRNAEPDEYRYHGSANFSDTTMSNLVGDIELTDAAGEVELNPRSLTVSSKAKLTEAPIDIVWRQNFFDEDGPSEFSLAGVVDASIGDQFGIAARRYLHGPVKFDVKALGDIGDFRDIAVNADFTDAALTIGAMGWRKSPSSQATADVSIKFTDETVEVSDLKITGDDLDIRGDIQFTDNGAVRFAELAIFKLKDAADLSLKLERSPANELSITALGKYLNAGAIVETITEGGNNDRGEIDWGPGVKLTARIDEISMRGGAEYSVTSLDLWRSSDELKQLDFSGFDPGGLPLSVKMSETGMEANDRTRTVSAHSNNIGHLLRAVFNYGSVEGGEGVLSFDLSEENADGLSGKLEARNITLSDAPLVARLFSAGSLDGLANLMNDQGINLTQAYGEFEIANKILGVSNFRATGPSVGITADGAVALGADGDIRLDGALAPFYQINSLLGNAPIFGELFVGKKGEGIVALSYAISGKRQSPSVSINPLSALTPGIFRQIMQPTDPASQVTESAQESDLPED
ncbi:MAG: DUF3971 domain-containing protein [Marinicaulis sp.]|nr:DUF3971 domain-containing protein [Marinicaulis sp.]